MNSALVIGGEVREVFPGKAKDDLTDMFSPSILANIVEIPGAVVAGQKWDGEKILPEPAPAAATGANVRLEASRRLQSVFAARDPKHLEIIISNASREAIRLLRTQAARAWTEAEAARAAELEFADTLVEAIRAASNAMEANPPADYRENKHWPSVPGA